MAIDKGVKKPPASLESESDWADLLALWKSIQNLDAYQRATHQALPKITEWRWANDAYYRPTPFYQELYKAPTLKWTKPDKGKVEHGLDAVENIHVMRNWPSSDRKRRRETFILRHAGADGDVHDEICFEAVWSSETAPSPKEIEPNYVKRIWFNGPRILAECHLKADGHSLTLHQYKSGKLATSTFDTINNVRHYRAHRDYRYLYDADGQIDSIESDYFFLKPELKLAESKVLFRRKAKKTK